MEDKKFDINLADNSDDFDNTRSFRAILLLDDISRAKIKTNVSEIGLYGVSIINTFSELTKDLVKETKTLIILDGYFSKANSVSDLHLYKYLYDLDIYCLGNVSQYTGRLLDIASVYTCDISSLDFELIQMALYGDNALRKKPEELSEDFTHLENINLARKILQDSVNYNQKLHSLASEYLSLKDSLNRAVNECEQLKSDYSVASNRVLKLEKENQKLIEGYSNVLEKTLKLNESLKEYEAILTADIYEKVDLTKYNNRPLVIYFKEMEEFIYLDEFIETLYFVFTNQYHKSCKIVRIYDSVKTRKISAIPDYYQILYNKFTSEDVVTHNFVCKTGDYRKMLDILLTNNSNLDVLIIFDHKDLNDFIISGSYLQFNLCRTYNNLECYGIKKENTIVNFGENKEDNSGWNYPEAQDVKDKEKKFLYLSSRPAITRVYALSKFYAESI